MAFWTRWALDTPQPVEVLDRSNRVLCELQACHFMPPSNADFVASQDQPAQPTAPDGCKQKSLTWHHEAHAGPHARAKMRRASMSPSVEVDIPMSHRHAVTHAILICSAFQVEHART